MKLPNLSYMMSVGELRYIQAQFETVAYRNPDSIVGAFLPTSKRLRSLVRSMAFLSRLRANPFYGYVLARTKYYDEVYVDAICAARRCIVNVGCGSDTRAYRFGHILAQKGMTTVECDQEAAIKVKEEIARRKWPTEHVTYLPIDLNQGNWPLFEELLARNRSAPILVMMEGVSPYVAEDSFKAFLRLLKTKLCPRSVVAYDYKIEGVADSFGRSADGRPLFRLAPDQEKVATFHGDLGYELQRWELGADLSRRLGPAGAVAFEEDALVQLSCR